MKDPRCVTLPIAALKKAGSLAASRGGGEWRSHLARATRIGIAVDRALFDYIEQEIVSSRGLDKGAARQLLSRATRLRLGSGAVHGEAIGFAEQTAGNIQKFGFDQGDALTYGIALDLTYSYLAGALPLSAWEQGLTLLERAELLTNWPDLERASAEHCFLGEDSPADRRTMIVLEGLGSGCASRMRYDARLAWHVTPLLSAWSERTPPPLPGTSVN